jgi:hypothetical protein
MRDGRLSDSIVTPTHSAKIRLRVGAVIGSKKDLGPLAGPRMGLRAPVRTTYGT